MRVLNVLVYRATVSRALSRSSPFIIFLASIVLLGVGLDRASIATPYSDLVARVRAQDESVHVNAAMAMATRGNWLTPTLMGRLFLFKPPLLLWMSAASVKVFGARLAALRLPALAFGAFTAVVVFLWARRLRGPAAGIISVVLLLSNPTWHTFSRLCYTDVIASAFCLAALYFFVADPELAYWRARLGFATATACAVMTKNIAGVLPVAAGLLYIVFAGERPRRVLLWRLTLTLVLTGVLVAPWHVYQAIVHPRWFWADYVQIQLLTVGLHPVGAGHEPAAEFYARRLLLTDPILCVLVFAASYGVIITARKREASSLILFCWIAAVGAALLVFQSRNAPYLVFLIPGLCIVAAGFTPDHLRRHARVTVVVLVGIAVLKGVAGNAPWAIRLGGSTPLPATAALRWYCEQRRGNELVMIDPDDEFHSATLGLSKVRYLFLDPDGVVKRYAPHYVTLGITVTVDQYLDLGRWQPLFRKQLSAWGLDSGEPIATAILAKSKRDIARVLSTCTDTDFYLPASLLGETVKIVEQTRYVVPAPPDRCFLLSQRRLPPGPTTGVLASRW